MALYSDDGTLRDDQELKIFYDLVSKAADTTGLPLIHTLAGVSITLIFVSCYRSWLRHIKKSQAPHRESRFY